MDITLTTYDNTNGQFPAFEAPKQNLAYAQQQAAALEKAAAAAQALGRIWVDDDGCIHWDAPTSATE